MSKWILAKNLSGNDLGSYARSEVYFTNKKTEKPRQVREYPINSIYIHKNGTILINGSHPHLRPETEIELLD